MAWHHMVHDESDGKLFTSLFVAFIFRPISEDAGSCIFFRPVADDMSLGSGQYSVHVRC